MQPRVSDNDVKSEVLRALAVENDRQSFDPQDVMKAALKKLCGNNLNKFDRDVQTQVLVAFNDLIRSGVVGLGSYQFIPNALLSGGMSLCTKFHVTPSGTALLCQADRDPINPPGYLRYLDEQASIDPITREYVEEALATFRACCYKATAVMIGAAVENLMLVLRDELLAGLQRRNQVANRKLSDYSIKRVTEAISQEVTPELQSASKLDSTLIKLRDDVEARLLPIAAEFRQLRNDAGHPASLSSVSTVDVHANLLQFTSTAKLTARLTDWIRETYK